MLEQTHQHQQQLPQQQRNNFTYIYESFSSSVDSTRTHHGIHDVQHPHKISTTFVQCCSDQRDTTCKHYRLFCIQQTLTQLTHSLCFSIQMLFAYIRNETTTITMTSHCFGAHFCADVTLFVVRKAKRNCCIAGGAKGSKDLTTLTDSITSIRETPLAQKEIATGVENGLVGHLLLLINNELCEVSPCS